jgi:hypothetical protein
MASFNVNLPIISHPILPGSLNFGLFLLPIGICTEPRIFSFNAFELAMMSCNNISITTTEKSVSFLPFEQDQHACTCSSCVETY